MPEIGVELEIVMVGLHALSVCTYFRDLLQWREWVWWGIMYGGPPALGLVAQLSD